MYVKTLRKRGAILVVEANAAVLFTPVGDFGRYASEFSNVATGAASRFAPTNKRPRWAHYGAPLRTTFTSKTKYQPGRLKVFMGIGSRSPHALYVDQGTGIHGGRGPYQAKILPPWHRGSPSLYEASWKVPTVSWGNSGNIAVMWRKQGTVTIKGQKGQFFMDKAIKQAFRTMNTRSVLVPGQIRTGEASGSTPTGLEGFSGATPWSFAFDTQLREWRAWRDDAWNRNRKLGGGPDGYQPLGSRRKSKGTWRRDQTRWRRSPSEDAARREKARVRAQKWRDKKKSMNKDVQKRRPKDQAARYREMMRADKATLIKVMTQRYGANFDRNSVELMGDRWEFLVKDGRDYKVHSVRAKFIDRFNASR
jgi:hypothetical protein